MASAFSHLTMLDRAVRFINQDLWRIRARRLNRKQSIFIRVFRVFILSLREFGNDQCYLRASALTFYSLLSIVPVFAMAFGIAKGFGLDNTLQEKVLERLQAQEEVMHHIIAFAKSLLENTSGGVVAGIGVLLLFWTVIKTLGNIEVSFNHIWGVKKERSIARKFTDYLSLMIVCPIFLIISSSVTVFIATEVNNFSRRFSLFGYLSPIMYRVLQLIPFMAQWILLTMLYIFMPNTKVRYDSAILGGFVAGALYQISQWIYINFQIGAGRYGAIYGSFAALPLFLVWLQTSWLIVFYGAEIAFAHQNEETYEFEDECQNASTFLKKVIAIRIVQLCVEHFQQGKPRWNAPQMADWLDLPIRLIRQILHELVQAGILYEIREENREAEYQVARPPEDLKASKILIDLERQGLQTIPCSNEKDLKKIRDYLDDLEKCLQASSLSVPVHQIR